MAEAIFIQSSFIGIRKRGFPMGLLEDARNIQRKDPLHATCWRSFAVSGFHILVYHRIAHWLYQHKRFFLARWVSQHGRRRTGIEIHPVPPSADACLSTTAWASCSARPARSGTTAPSTTVSLWAAPARTPASATHSGQQRADRCRHQVLGPVYIGDNSRIGAGSVVLRNLPATAPLWACPPRWCASTTRP